MTPPDDSEPLLWRTGDVPCENSRPVGLHPFALALAAGGWSDETVLLVAHHSHADVLAQYFDAEDPLALLDQAPSEAEDILTYADLRSGPTGMGADPRERFAEMRLRPRLATRWLVTSPTLPCPSWIAPRGPAT